MDDQIRQAYFRQRKAWASSLSVATTIAQMSPPIIEETEDELNEPLLEFRPQYTQPASNMRLTTHLISPQERGSLLPYDPASYNFYAVYNQLEKIPPLCARNAHGELVMVSQPEALSPSEGKKEEASPPQSPPPPSIPPRSSRRLSVFSTTQSRQQARKSVVRTSKLNRLSTLSIDIPPLPLPDEIEPRQRTRNKTHRLSTTPTDIPSLPSPANIQSRQPLKPTAERTPKPNRFRFSTTPTFAAPPRTHSRQSTESTLSTVLSTPQPFQHSSHPPITLPPQIHTRQQPSEVRTFTPTPTPLSTHHLSPPLQQHPPTPLSNLSLHPTKVTCPTCQAQTQTRTQIISAASKSKGKRSAWFCVRLVADNKVEKKGVDHYCTRCGSLLARFWSETGDVEVLARPGEMRVVRMEAVGGE